MFFLLIPQPTSAVFDYFRKEGLLNFDNFLESDNFDAARQPEGMRCRAPRKPTVSSFMITTLRRIGSGKFGVLAD